MKYTLKSVIVVLLCLMLAACGNGGVPSGMSKEAYEIGNKIVDTASAFLDGDMDNIDSYSKVEKLFHQIQTGTEYKKDSELYSLSIALYLALSDSSSSEVIAIKGEINDLLGK